MNQLHKLNFKTLMFLFTIITTLSTAYPHVPRTRMATKSTSAFHSTHHSPRKILDGLLTRSSRGSTSFVKYGLFCKNFDLILATMCAKYKMR